MKLRAWNEYKQKYYYFKGGNYYSDSDCKNLWSFINCDEFDWENQEQHIGMEDKNEVELYEGDKVKVEYFKLGVGAGLGVIEIEEELTGIIAFDGLSISLIEIENEKWSEHTGYEPKEGSCKIMHLHDVYESSTDAEWQIEIITSKPIIVQK